MIGTLFSLFPSENKNFSWLYMPLEVDETILNIIDYLKTIAIVEFDP